MGTIVHGQVRAHVGKSTFLSWGTNWVCKGPRGQQCEGGVSKAAGRTRGLIFEPQTGGQRNRVGGGQDHPDHSFSRY